MSNHKPIHASVWSPLDKSLFKYPAKDPATCEVYYCEKAESCGLLQKGQCIHASFLGPRCPHGYVRKETGPTKYARSCSDWVRKKRDEFKDVLGKVRSSPSHKIVEVGDWIYLPYSHLDMNEKLPIIAHSHLFVSGSPFMKKYDFTIEVIKRIVDFRPYALMGGEITDYQKKEVPKFLLHLSETYPELYKQLLDANPEYVERYNLTVKNYVGRKALLKTTNPFNIEIGKHKFQWNGETLVSISFDPLWIDVVDENDRKAIDKIDVKIVPSDKAAIKIVSNDQVNPNTVFLD